MNATHNCRATGCTRRIKVELLMCPFHWRLVPKELQGRVYTAYNRYVAATKNCDFNATRTAAEDLRRVQAEASAAVGEPSNGPRSA
jgi:hypothetical protein